MLLRKQFISKNMNYIRKQSFIYRKFSHKGINYFNKTNVNFNEKRIHVFKKIKQENNQFQ